MKTPLLMFLFLSLAGPPVLTAKSVELRLTVDFIYQDLVRHCSSMAESIYPPNVFLRGEAAGSVLISATLSNWVNAGPAYPIYRTKRPMVPTDPYLERHRPYCDFNSFPIYKVSLLASELKAIELYQDKKGMVWIHKMALGPRLLDWLFFHAKARGHAWCVPSQPLKTIGPVPVVFSFETEGLGEDYFESYTPAQNFSGELSDGSSYYEARLKFVQTDVSELIRFLNGHRRHMDAKASPWEAE